MKTRSATRTLILSGVVVAALCGCGAALAPKPVPPGSLVLATALPAPSASPFGLSAGTAQSHRRFTLAAAPVDLVVHEQPAVHHAPQAVPLRARALAHEQPAALATAAPQSGPAAPTQLVAKATADQPLRSDTQRYAQRADPKLEKYRGGDVIVVGASTLLIVLLVVILVLLLVR